MKRILAALFVCGFLMLLPNSASAQSVSNVCLSLSPYTCHVYQNTYLTVYGSGLPTLYTTTHVRVCSDQQCLFEQDYGQAGQPYWYVSSTQINFKPTAAPIVSSDSGGGPWVQVCGNTTSTTYLCTAGVGPLPVSGF